MLITLGSSTDLGRRETNQDSVLAILAQNLLPKRQLAPAAAKPVSRRDQNPAASYVQSSALLILADGMGGRASGQLASETAAKSVYRELAHTLAMQDGVDAPYLEKALDGAIQQANNRIHQLAAKKAEAEGMGTTCTAALVMYDMICIGHVGDSRAYLCSGLESDEPMHRDAQPAGIALLTADHSVVAGEVRAGRLTEEEARLSRFRNVITRAVGVDLDVEPDVFTCPVPEGGISHLVLTSDGLHGSVDDAEMRDILCTHARAPQSAANALVAAAKRAGATDNISVIVARIDATGENYKEGAAPLDDYDNEQNGKRNNNGVFLQTGESNVGFWSKHIIWQIGCAVLALAAVAAWFVPGLFRSPASVSPPNPPVSAPQPILENRINVYSSPEALLPGRPLAPSLLVLQSGVAPADGNLLVVDTKAKRLLTIRTSDGLVATSLAYPGVLDATPEQNSSAFPITADASGAVYRVGIKSGQQTILLYNVAGQFINSIDAGQFTRITAIAVAPSGDIFVIDNNALKRISLNGNAPVPLTHVEPSDAR